MTSQNSCDANVVLLKGGNAPLWPDGCSVCELVAISITRSRLEREQQQQRDQQREDAERFGHGEAEDQVAELALGGRRIAQRGSQIVAENDADADAGAAHADAGNAGTDIFCCDWIHNELLCLNARAFSGPDG